MVHAVAVRRRTPALTALAPRLALGLALALAVAACSHDGRTLAPTLPGQTTTTTRPPTLDDSASDAFTLVTDAVEDGGELPARFTCYGAGTSPPLKWSGVPTGTVSLAIIVRDRDADGYVHWDLTGIDPTLQGFGEGGIPEGVVEQVNQTGTIGWKPPCPPDGGTRHIYDISIHALQSRIEIDPGLPADEAASQIERASAAKAGISLTVTPPASGVGSTEA